MPQPLASKERTLFSQVVKNYENKQYKKGIKAAEQILRKNPNHGDTQAMKALILNNLSQSEEAFALAKTALTNDMKSHICWHVYGLLYRSAKNFEESIKAYKFALKIEPESQQIQRDLALLQMQMRDYSGYVQSRRAMLQSKPGLRSNWTALAVAQHLSGDLIGAERTLTTYEDTLKSPPPRSDVEHQEAVLYKISIMAEMDQTEKALERLDAASKGLFDKQTVMELRASYLLMLDRKDEAAKVYRALLVRNPENREYYDGLQLALGLNTSDKEKLQKLYAEFAEKNPRSDAARRIPLDFLDGEEFRQAADHYLQRMLNKGVPSTFANIKALYTDSSKLSTIQELANGYVSKTSAPEDSTTNGQSDGDSSCFKLSILYFLAQHYDYHKSRDLSKAMQYIDNAIEQSPKSVDYYMTKARIFKHEGDVKKAAEVMEHARSLDERDRYINTKAAKYLIRNDQNAAALDLLSKFTRNEAVGGPLGDLLDMQCMWFLCEDGDSYIRQGKLGLALKRFTSIYNIFEVWQEDQFDFHNFSIRKGQIRAYVDMIRWEDHLRDHPYFTHAAISAIKAYVFLHDKPHLAHDNMANGTNGTNGDANERKKAARKAKKAQEKQEQLDAEKKDAKKTAGGNTDAEAKKEDKDPEGKLLLETKEPLKDAMKFLTLMLESSPKSLEAQRAGFEVFLRRGKYLLALRCLLATHSIDSSSPTFHSQLLRLQHTISTLSTPLPSKTAEVIASKLKPLLPSASSDLKTLNDEYLTNHTDPECVFAGLEVRCVLDPDSRAEESKKLLEILEKEKLRFEGALNLSADSSLSDALAQIALRW